ncbi:VOC family protein [Spongiactinospora rosea]|uniref:VOC family protein n=1 Tax=Spongiactinospora rosea TaxID=2248750 RepID=A0A366LU64_9ACTN|nr:VOC family protein [Spongiactinospora rosea]RBQ16752.1 VOC family protein [Spongiactinospora rosea]
MTGTDLRLSSCTLLVHDLGAALAFYRDVLGLEVRDHARPSVGPPAQPDVRIILQPADRQVIEDLTSNGLLGGLGFVTGDCDATFARIEAAGAEVMQEPIDRPGGVRDCAFLDPSGNLLRFTQPAADPVSGSRRTPPRRCPRRFLPAW